VPCQSISSSFRRFEATAVSAKDEVETSLSQTASQSAVAQAPNRADVWARSQQPRSKAMAGPRFEQTDFHLQVRPRKTKRKPAISASHLLSLTETSPASTVLGDGAHSQAAGAMDE
jgi:hypothetical protein